ERIRTNLDEQGVDISSMKKLHCGIDLSLFENNKETESVKTKIFLQVSSLVDKKGHEYTLEAFSIFLKSSNNFKCKLILTGGGERIQELKNLAIELGVDNSVEFLGFVSPQKAKELMQNADFFVHHSITSKSGDQEGIPTAIMEAMAMELPILSTKHAGIPELVEDGVNGYLVEEKDVELYAKRMQDILSWKKQTQNRKVIEDRFNYITHNLMLEEFYESIF
ncbi:MAG: glycosyltransferase, partial [Clostridiales bacterium]|nr:glycosyltransferase [Clostridiales bacterium]